MISFIHGSAFLDTKFVSISVEPGHSFLRVDGQLVIDAIDRILIHGFGLSISRITVPPSLEILAPFCFASCKQLSVVVFPSDSALRRIESCAFFQTNVSSIILPDCISFIAADAFPSTTNVSLAVPSSEFDEWKSSGQFSAFHRQRSSRGRQIADLLLDQATINTVKTARPTSGSIAFLDLPSGIRAAVKYFSVFHQPDEAQWLAEFDKRLKLDHPCISPVIGFAPSTDGEGFKIVRIARGQSLKELLGTQVSWWTSTAQVIVIVGIILGGIAVHAAGLVHCNLKPSNILLDDKHRVQLTDFGFPGLPGFSRSAPYSAPEIGKEDKVSDKCDIFSFGWILYHICTPSPATAIRMQFQAVKQSMTHKFLKRDGMDISKDLPPFVTQMIRSAWSPDPSERPSFWDLLAVLQENNFKVFADVDMDEVLDFINWVESAKH
jgi:hypothetical protein